MKERAYFNDKADEWDTLMPSTEMERVKSIIGNTNVTQGSSVLDIGCGTGIIVPSLREMVGAKGGIVAVDVAEKMLEKALAKMPHERRMLGADVHYLPFVDAAFDTVVAFNCFPHFNNKLQAFKEILRVLRPGGSFYICHSQSREGINALHRDIGDAVKEDRIPNEPEMRGLFEGAGFREIEVKNSSASYLARGVKNSESQ